MAGTLPLFDELEAPGPGGTPAPAATAADNSRAAGTTRAATDDARPTTTAKADSRHLQAARRLSRSMRRFPDRSPQQTRAGIAICRHLRAHLRSLLAESELDG